MPIFIFRFIKEGQDQWLYQFLIIAYLFTLSKLQPEFLSDWLNKNNNNKNNIIA